MTKLSTRNQKKLHFLIHKTNMTKPRNRLNVGFFKNSRCTLRIGKIKIKITTIKKIHYKFYKYKKKKIIENNNTI